MTSAPRVFGDVEAALDRFAQETDQDGRALTIGFKNFNKRRVDDFVHEPYNSFKQKEATKERDTINRRTNTETKTDIAGKLR